MGVVDITVPGISAMTGVWRRLYSIRPQTEEMNRM